MSSKRSVFAVTALLLACVAAQSADFIGPRLEGTITLQSGESYTGLVLSAWLGMVDGAQIGSTLQDGGYISLRADDTEHRVQATDIASLEADWVQAGTPAEPKWKIDALTVVTKDGRRLVGSPTWLIHATSVVLELPDGTPKKIHAIPMAGADFSPDNLLTKIVLGEAAAPTETAPPTTEETAVGPTVTVEPVPTEATTTEPTATEEPLAAEATTTEATTTEEPVTTTVEPVATEGPAPTTVPPVVEAVGEGVVLAGEPAIVTFVITCPHTGKPVKVRFLIVPLPATE